MIDPQNQANNWIRTTYASDGRLKLIKPTSNFNDISLEL